MVFVKKAQVLFDANYLIDSTDQFFPDYYEKDLTQNNLFYKIDTKKSYFTLML